MVFSLSPAAKLKPLIHVEGDFLTYGLGGFSTYPKGFGSDVSYLNRSAYSGLLGRRAMVRKIAADAVQKVETGIASEFFVSSFISRIRHMALYEWHFEKCRIFFEYCKATFPQFRSYADFNQFAASCIGGLPGITPMDLENIIRERTRAFFRGDMDEIVERQPYLLQRHAEDVLRRVFIEMMGPESGLFLYNEAIKQLGERPLSLKPEHFSRSYFVSSGFVELLKTWHWNSIRSWVNPETIRGQMQQLEWPEAPKAPIRTARRDMLKTLAQLPRPLLQLIWRLQVPLFVATADNANFFRFFHSGLPLAVMKNEDDLKEYVMHGLSVHRPYYQSAIIVTHGQKTPEKFFHVVAEECTHFADGPVDRWSFKGGQRYSATSAFDEAYRADRSNIPPWDRTGILGAKEWGQYLTQRKVNRLTRARVQKRIEAYEATLNFDHYPKEERAAEIFAALPILERALGRALARRMLPNLFAYYDKTYLPALYAESRDLK